jgi:hypothetical protein
VNLSIELKTRVYEHIGQVRKHLGEFPADEQREILESIETHIHDALESRSEGTPTMELLDVIIAELDPPESYGPPPVSTSNRTPSSILRGWSMAAVLLVAGAAVAWALVKDAKNAKDEPESKPDAKPASMVAPKPKPPIVGHWVSVDFVPTIDAFNPDQRQWKGDLELRELAFLPDGKTDKSWWTWEDNTLSHSGDQTQAKFTLAWIEQKEYLFIEWMSKDAIRDSQKPSYYVLTRGSYIDPDKPKIITEGIGWDNVRIGASRDELINILGAPEPVSQYLTWEQCRLRAEVSNGRIVTLSFYGEDWKKTKGLRRPSTEQEELAASGMSLMFDWKTSKGIRMHSSEQEVLAAYGQPSTIDMRDGHKAMSWPKEGLTIHLNSDSEVYFIDIFAPR